MKKTVLDKTMRRLLLCEAVVIGLLVLGMTGLLQSHLISTEAAALFITITRVILLRKTFPVYRFVALVKVALLDLGFLVPMLDSMWMDIPVKNDKLRTYTGVGSLFVLYQEV